MDSAEHRNTDGASIRPVSSLLSHFEGLKTQHKTPAGDVPAKPVPGPKPFLDGPRAAFPLRASLDLSRPAASWKPNVETPSAPKTPSEARGGGSSPTRSGHKRPMSMHVSSSSPQLTPMVNVESPHSPPHHFFTRNSSRSPERMEITPFGKVRELISQHSSRSSTRYPSPSLEDDPTIDRRGRPSKDDNQYFPGPRSASPAKLPPLVNRADKPRISAKPLSVSQAGSGRLTPEPRRLSMDIRVSPFSTPPSSAENSPVQSPTHGLSPFLPDDVLSSPEIVQYPARHDSLVVIAPKMSRENIVSSAVTPTSHATDPRSLGFNTIPVPAERQDPRSLGFSSTIRPVPAEPVVVPVRANTVNERSTPRDPRGFGLSATRPTPRAVSESVRHLPSPTSSAAVQHRVPAQRSTMSRDPRQFGFSAPPSGSTPDEGERRPSLPARRAPQLPPPRPSEASKTRSRPPSRGSPQRAAEVPSREVVPDLKANAPIAKEHSFLPPPKRNTFNEETSRQIPRTPPLSRSTTLDTRQARHDNGAESSDEVEKDQEPNGTRTDYPDSTNSNRRPPYNLSGHYEIPTRSEGRVFDVCGNYLCVASYVTRIFDTSSGEQIVSINHGETVKITSVKFKPGSNLDNEGSRLWLGNSIGDLLEVDVDSHSVIASSSVHNRREIIRILRCCKSLWTLDDDGKLFVWRPDESGSLNMKYNYTSHRVQRGHTFSMVIQDKLWLATGKDVRIYRPGNEAQFQVLTQPLSQPNSGDITSGTFSADKGGRVYFGHTDGKVTIYSTSDHSCMGTIKLSDYKINELTFVGEALWVAYKTGMVYVYDVSMKPWKVKKDWRAHQGPTHGMILDPSSVWTMQRLQVVTAGHDNFVRIWDATLEKDWMERALQEKDTQYCTFRDLRAAVVTWNVGAAVPTMIRSDFIADAINAEDPPEILVFGFQEVVDLEDRAVTAKSLLGFAKKKDTTKSEQHQSRIYREWRDYLARCISRYTDGKYAYSEVSTSSLIGLCQCVFIRQEERRNISMLSTTNVKCGMGGHYGNKGALVTRFVIDDSSLCFVNCHLAAGQSHTSHRNNDIATILESESLPVEPNRQVRTSLFVGGGDGTQILDHETTILSGDLNYRIDTVPRDTVIKMIRNNELPKLLERDQIMVSRRRVTGFRLASFTESPITFNPTYKYDVGTDDYDSSEKKRSPAWCDRILHRSGGGARCKQLSYRRHDGVRVSDHRPVSGIFRLRIKTVDVERRDLVLDECHERFKGAKKRLLEGVCTRWLVEGLGVSEGEARRLLA